MNTLQAFLEKKNKKADGKKVQILQVKDLMISPSTVNTIMEQAIKELGPLQELQRQLISRMEAEIASLKAEVTELKKAK